MKEIFPHTNYITKQILYILPFVLCFLLFYSKGYSQEKKRIEIIHADALEQSEANRDVQKLIGNVNLSHEGALMFCDSAYVYEPNNMDAFGNVKINQGDTIFLYSNKLFYKGNIKEAIAIGNVRLVNVNEGTTLYSDTLNYNLDTHIGFYDDFGKIVDSTNTLTSMIGQYHMREKMAYFYKDVEVLNEDFTLESDTLRYNTETGMLFIEGPTTIMDSANTMYAEDGWYNSQTGESELLKNPMLHNENQSLKGNLIKYFKETGKGYALGSVEIVDNKNQLKVNGEHVTYDENLEASMVTDSALLTLYSEEDTLYLHADTITAIPDTVKDEKIVKAFHGVRFFRNDVQGVCDSLVYFTVDTTVYLFVSPILWAGTRQMTSEFIQMKSSANAPDEVRLYNNAFIISRQDSVMYDQIKGKNMIGYIRDNSLYKIDVDGNGQTLYYAQDKTETIGLNSAESSKITIRFKDNKVYSISFLSNPEGVLNPINQIADEQRKLNGFGWHASKRPLTRFDVFRETKKAGQ